MIGVLNGVCSKISTKYFTKNTLNSSQTFQKLEQKRSNGNLKAVIIHAKRTEQSIGGDKNRIEFNAITTLSDFRSSVFPKKSRKTPKFN
jgi:hypothetical protein